MAEATTEYPKRPKFFAYKLTRMMFKTALANDIGPEACHLIIQIAHTEDATRYSKAVTFYNEQLLPVCGFTNVKSLDRARAKAVKSGWLVYKPGGKSKAGKYWTTIPEQYIHMDDSSIDESNSSSELQATNDDATSLPVAGKETGDKRETNGRQEPEKREVSARETPDNRATIIPVPSPKTNPNPEYIPPNPQAKIVQSCPPDESVTAIEVDGELITYDQDHIRWVPEFIRRWNSLPGVRRHDGNALSTPNLRALRERLTEHDWFWRRAFAKFPLYLPDGVWQITLGTFLQPATVSNILDGKYGRRTTEAGLFAGGQKQEPGRIRTGATSDAIEQAMAEAAAKRGGSS